MKRPLPITNSNRPTIRSLRCSAAAGCYPNVVYPNVSDKSSYQEIDFKELMQEIIEAQKDLNEEHEVEIQFNIRSEAVFISYRHHMQTVLSNLIAGTVRSQRNAIVKPYVYIKIHSSEKGANILIRNSSTAVKDEAFQIFNMLYRETTSTEQLGVELYLVKETLKKLNGRIDVNFEMEAATEYRIKLPNLFQ